MIPKCHNRPPVAEGRWFFTGETRRGKPVMRWHPRWFEDRCATHDGVGIGPNNENYPAARGWDCSGCRLDPRSIEKRRQLNFILAAADANPIPDDGRRWFVDTSALQVRDIDAFEPIQLSIQRERI